jgi:hypothetical protein
MCIFFIYSIEDSNRYKIINFFILFKINKKNDFKFFVVIFFKRVIIFIQDLMDIYLYIHKDRPSQIK